MRPYTHFTMDERVCLQSMRELGKSISEMAQTLKRNRSSIYREFKRNQNKDGTYNSYRGHCLYVIRRRHCHKQPKFAFMSDMNAYFCERLKLLWPPAAIVHEWNEEHAQSRVSVRTVYRSIRQSLLPEIRAKEHLRRRGKCYYGKRSKFNAIQPEHRIQDREAIINERGRIGDWEGDTIAGAHCKTGLITLVDRKSRLVRIRLVLHTDAKTTGAAIEDGLRDVEHHSLTLDNGPEFSEFRRIEADLAMPIYFADPHSPWQRGTNENTNGLIRFFFPRGTDFSKVIPERVALVEKLLNERPRKCLGWRSPAQVFSDPCCT